MMYSKCNRNVSLKELSEYLNEACYGDTTTMIKGIAGINEADEGDITFAVKPKYIKSLKTSKASAVIISAEVKVSEVKVPYIISKNPYYTFARILEFFFPKQKNEHNIHHQSASIAKSASIGKNVTIYPGCFIGENAKIDDGAVIYPGCFIGENTHIGNESWLYSNVTLRENCTVGKNCIIHSGAVIGADGYGFVKHENAYYKIPQVGNVVIEDNVEIGANVTCDRATIGSTKVGSGTKVDNLVHIAHNVQIGKNVLIVAQVGISGSVDIGDDVTIAGQSGIVGHISIGPGSVIAARSVVTSDVKPKSFISGFPAKPHNEEMKIKAAMKKLPELVKDVKEIKKLLKIESKKKSEDNSSDI